MMSGIISIVFAFESIETNRTYLLYFSHYKGLLAYGDLWNSIL